MSVLLPISVSYCQYQILTLGSATVSFWHYCQLHSTIVSYWNYFQILSATGRYYQLHTILYYQPLPVPLSLVLVTVSTTDTPLSFCQYYWHSSQFLSVLLTLQSGTIITTDNCLSDSSRLWCFITGVSWTPYQAERRQKVLGKYRGKARLLYYSGYYHVSQYPYQSVYWRRQSLWLKILLTETVSVAKNTIDRDSLFG